MRKRTVLAVLLTILVLSLLSSTVSAQDYGGQQGWFGDTSPTESSGGPLTGIWGMFLGLFGPLFDIDLSNETHAKLLIGILLFAVLGMLTQRVIKNNRISWVIAFILALIVSIATPGKVIAAIAQTYAFAFVAIALGAVLLIFFLLHKQLKNLISPEEHPRGYHMLAALYYALLLVIYQSFFGILIMLFESKAGPTWFLEIKSFFGMLLVIIFFYHLMRALFTGIGGAAKGAGGLLNRFRRTKVPSTSGLGTSTGQEPPSYDTSKGEPGAPPGPGRGEGKKEEPKPEPKPEEKIPPTEPVATEKTEKKEEAQPRQLPPGQEIKSLPERGTGASTSEAITKAPETGIVRKKRLFGLLPPKGGTGAQETARAMDVEEREKLRLEQQEENIINLIRGIDMKEMGDLKNMDSVLNNMGQVIEQMDQFGGTQEQVANIQDTFNNQVKRIEADLELNENKRKELVGSLKGMEKKIAKYANNEAS
ncbi:hypothetical protein GF374_03325, partial [Candidatus Woesearchaeota archaeon]|nr:hypothetical protein [Candidatus Woesearchaeota archaeon]